PGASFCVRVTAPALTLCLSTLILACQGSNPESRAPVESGGSTGGIAVVGGSASGGSAAGGTTEPADAAGNAGGVAGSGDGGTAPPLGQTSDVLGTLPDVLYLKTDTQSYNRLYYFAVFQGDLWMKPNVERTGTDGAWTKVLVPQIPSGQVAQVSA